MKQSSEPMRDFGSDSMVAVAVNVRRIFILLAITIFLTLGTTVLGLLITNLGFDFDGAKTASTIWMVIAVIFTAAALWYSVKIKRVTKL